MSEDCVKHTWIKDGSWTMTGTTTTTTPPTTTTTPPTTTTTTTATATATTRTRTRLRTRTNGSSGFLFFYRSAHNECLQRSWGVDSVSSGINYKGELGWKGDANLGGCFKYFLFSPLPGEMIQIDFFQMSHVFFFEMKEPSCVGTHVDPAEAETLVFTGSRRHA